MHEGLKTDTTLSLEEYDMVSGGSFVFNVGVTITSESPSVGVDDRALLFVDNPQER